MSGEAQLVAESKGLCAYLRSEAIGAVGGRGMSLPELGSRKIIGRRQKTDQGPTSLRLLASCERL